MKRTMTSTPISSSSLQKLLGIGSVITCSSQVSSQEWFRGQQKQARNLWDQSSSRKGNSKLWLMRTRPVSLSKSSLIVQEELGLRESLLIKRKWILEKHLTRMAPSFSRNRQAFSGKEDQLWLGTSRTCRKILLTALSGQTKRWMKTRKSMRLRKPTRRRNQCHSNRMSQS